MRRDRGATTHGLVLKYGRAVWSDLDDEIIGGDLTAALAYLTPAGGVVVTPVAPLGLRDRDSGTVSFTTSLGFGRKLDRITANPRVALAFHAREHGFARNRRFVLVQGTASYDAEPDSEFLETRIGPASARFMGEPQRGLFWDRWLSVYYGDRVVVTTRVERVLSWHDLACAGEPTVVGTPRPLGDLPSQAAPKMGEGPRIDVSRAVQRTSGLPHALLGYLNSDGFPMAVPVSVGAADANGIALHAHRFEAKLVGLETRQYTGWLKDGVYAPHTEGGFRAPANKTILLLANGYMARRGMKRARAAGRG
jgi:pyridoxamine 5'-phosphate oxidase-like protein